MKYFNLPQSYHDIMDQWKFKISPTWTVIEAHHNIKESKHINTFQHRTGQNSLYFISGSEKNRFFSSCPSKRRIQSKLEKYGSTSMLRSEYSFKVSLNLQRIKSNKNHITRQIISSLPVLVERTNQKTLLCTCPTR